MKEIPLTRGKVALVDDEDYEWLMQWKWYYNGDGYAVRGINGGKNQVRMHREIAKTPIGMETDHINHDRLDNRKCNLRVCKPFQNKMNKGFDSRNTSGYKGVSWHKGSRKWFVYIRFNYQRVNIGLFDDIIEAAKAYDKAARKYHGEFANLNFPDLS